MCGQQCAVGGGPRAVWCAQRRSYLRSAEHRGMPAGAPTFFVIEIEAGHALSEWETLAEARASVAFATEEAAERIGVAIAHALEG